MGCINHSTFETVQTSQPGGSYATNIQMHQMVCESSEKSISMLFSKPSAIVPVYLYTWKKSHIGLCNIDWQAKCVRREITVDKRPDTSFYKNECHNCHGKISKVAKRRSEITVRSSHEKMNHSNAQIFESTNVLEYWYPRLQV